MKKPVVLFLKKTKKLKLKHLLNTYLSGIGLSTSLVLTHVIFRILRWVFGGTESVSPFARMSRLQVMKLRFDYRHRINGHINGTGNSVV